MRLGLLLLSLCLLACAAPRPTAQAPWPPWRRAQSWSCGLRGAEVHCVVGTTRLVLAVPFVARAVAARPRGGAYVLGEHGRLARFSARGLLSGLAETELRSLTSSHDFVCGLDERGLVHCARDSSHDRMCAESDIAPFALVSAQPVLKLFVDREQDRLCLLDHAGERRCTDARARCERSCLAFPACATPRCIDPCPATSGPRSSIFFSALPPRAATLPE